MTKIYKRLVFLIVLVLGISSAVIYFTVDIHTFSHLNAFKPWSIILAVICLMIGLYFDVTRLTHLVRISGERIKFIEAMHVIFGNYFLALLTPGMAGGAIAQVMFLRRAGVPIGKATVLVVVRTLLSLFFLFICLPFIFYFDPGVMPWISEKLLFILSLAAVTSILGITFLFRTSVPNFFLVYFTKKCSYSRRRRIFATYRDIRGAILMLSSVPASMLRVFFESAISLLSLYNVVPVLFSGLGAEFHWTQILGRMIFLNILIYFAPTPGGSGVAEGGFILLFGDFVPSGTVGIAAVIWRIIVEYLPFIIGLYFTMKEFGHTYLAKQLE